MRLTFYHQKLPVSSILVIFQAVTCRRILLTSQMISKYLFIASSLFEMCKRFTRRTIILLCRHAEREPRFYEFCPCTFDYSGKKYKALMVNISKQGAQFQLENTTGRAHIEIGDELDLTIRTPYGQSKSKGVVHWTLHSSEFFKWGVRLIRVSSLQDDPIRCLMDSPF